MDSAQNLLVELQDWLHWLPNPVVALIIVALAITMAYALHHIVRRGLRRALARRYPKFFAVFVRMRDVTQLALLILALIIAVPVAPFDPATAHWLSRLLLIAVITLIGWAALTALRIGADLYLGRFRLDTGDNLLARKHVTQVRVLMRAADVMIILVTIGAALMTFEPVRQYGVSLFASAGVAGIVAGLAARPVLSNLFAGVQLAVTQPIRIDDAVIVENESGSIEEITSTYVVVRLWDWRRMIVPLSYFIQKPFQNWTRESSALLGTTFLYLDYRAPIDAIRGRFDEILKQSKNWDGQISGVQVTDAKEHTIEVRCLMSAPSAGQAFDLRCEVREKLIDFLNKEHPEALPVQRQVRLDERSEGRPEQRLREEAPDTAPADHSG